MFCCNHLLRFPILCNDHFQTRLPTILLGFQKRENVEVCAQRTIVTQKPQSSPGHVLPTLVSQKVSEARGKVAVSEPEALVPAPPLGRGGDPSTTLSPSSRGPPASAAALALLTRPGAAGPHVAGRSQRPEGAAGPGARSQSPEPAPKGPQQQKRARGPAPGAGAKGAGPAHTHARASRGRTAPATQSQSPAGQAVGTQRGGHPGRGSALPCRGAMGSL